MRDAPVPSVRTSSKSRTLKALELPPSSLFRGCCWISSGGSTGCSQYCATNCFSCRARSGVATGEVDGGDECCEWLCW